MPQLRNAKKALRQSEKRAIHNKNVKDNIRFLTKSTRKLAAGKDANTDSRLKDLVKAIDKAAQKGILKKNTAARKKSRIFQQMKRLKESAK